VFRDYGAGLSIDELVGMRAKDIASLTLPNEASFINLKKEARTLCDQAYEDYVLMELWGNGETVWMGGGPQDVVVVWPSGQIQARHDDSTFDG
jgi:hypothetical protein